MDIEFYTPEQMDEIVEFLDENFGKTEYVAHEIKSDYVHTDVHLSSNDEMRNFVTFGMGARTMDSPASCPDRIELVMHSSTAEDINDHALLQCLVSLSKYPFRNDTWFGAWHTVDVPQSFKETFGYDFVLLIPTDLEFSPSDKVNGVEKVDFLAAIPLYEDERDWVVENHGILYLYLLGYKFGEDIFKVDFKREHYIPSEEDLAFLTEENNLAD